MGSGPSLAIDVSMNTALSEADRAKYQDPGVVMKILSTTKTVAIVGLSPRPERPSYFVGSYLKSQGYHIIPVNPRATEILGEKSYPDLLSIPEPVDCVDVFRAPEECLEVARQAIQIGAKTLWFQFNVINYEAAQLAADAGLNMIMDRCMKVEHGRYSGQLHWVGMNTEIISARRGKRFF